MRPSTADPQPPALTQRKFCVLFLLLLATLILYPYLQDGGFAYFAFRVFGAAGILLAVYAIRLRRTLLLVALLLAVPALLERVLLRRPNGSTVATLSPALSNTVLLRCPSGLIVATLRPAWSYAVLLRRPSGSMLATVWPAGS